jgi:hypothetical protein
VTDDLVIDSNADDASMPPVRRFPTVLPGTVCLLAVGVMVLAVFLPYTGFPTDGLMTGDGPPDQITMNVIGGSDVWYVLGALTALSVVAACHLAGIRRRVDGLIALSVSVFLVGLALKLPGTWQQAAVVYGEAYVLDIGFYVFLGGAVTAVVGALLMVLTADVGLHRKRATPLQSSPS